MVEFTAKPVSTIHCYFSFILAIDIIDNVGSAHLKL